jgi:hypothetical protein
MVRELVAMVNFRIYDSGSGNRVVELLRLTGAI